MSRVLDAVLLLIQDLTDAELSIIKNNIDGRLEKSFRCQSPDRQVVEARLDCALSSPLPQHDEDNYDMDDPNIIKNISLEDLDKELDEIVISRNLILFHLK
jgi:hypothetical protein